MYSKTGKSIFRRSLSKCIAQDVGEDICTEDDMREMIGHAGEDM